MERKYVSHSWKSLPFFLNKLFTKNQSFQIQTWIRNVYLKLKKNYTFISLSLSLSLYIYIYIYIYIYSHPQTESFVVSEFISVARCGRCFKLGLKPSWYYASWISYHTAIDNLSISKGVLHIYIIFPLFIYALNSYQRGQFVRIYIYIYIYIYICVCVLIYTCVMKCVCIYLSWIIAKWKSY